MFPLHIALTDIRTEGPSTSFALKWVSRTDFLRVFLKAEAVCDPSVQSWGGGGLGSALRSAISQPRSLILRTQNLLRADAFPLVSVCWPQGGEGKELWPGVSLALRLHFHIHYWLWGLTATRGPC